MKSNVFLIIEIILTIAFLFFLLNNIIPRFEVNLGGFIEEDIYASLISLNYIEISSKVELENKVCSILNEILSDYVVYINGSFICGIESEEYTRFIKFFYIINGDVLYIYIGLK